MESFYKRIASIFQALLFVIMAIATLYFWLLQAYVIGSMSEYSRSVFFSTYGALYHESISLLLFVILIVTFILRSKKIWWTIGLFVLFCFVFFMTHQETTAKMEVVAGGIHYSIPWQYFPPNNTGSDGVALRVIYPSFKPVEHAGGNSMVIMIYKFPDTEENRSRLMTETLLDAGCRLKCIDANKPAVYFKDGGFIYKIANDWGRTIDIHSTQEQEELKRSTIAVFNKLIVPTK